MIFLLLLTVAAVLLISFACSLTEAVLLSLNPLSLKLQEKKGSTVSGRWLKLKNQIERPASAILIFNTLASTGLATLAGALSTEVFGNEWLWLFSVIISVLVLLGGEMAPKVIGVHHAEKLAPRLIGPLTWMLRLCYPLVLLMEKFCERLKRTSHDGRTQSDHIMDIITLVQSARAEQLLHNQEEIIMIHAATLSARRVKTAMVPHKVVKSSARATPCWRTCAMQVKSSTAAIPSALMALWSTSPATSVCASCSCRISPPRRPATGPNSSVPRYALMAKPP